MTQNLPSLTRLTVGPKSTHDQARASESLSARGTVTLMMSESSRLTEFPGSESESRAKPDSVRLSMITESLVLLVVYGP